MAVVDDSMVPTLLPGDGLYVDPRSYRRRPPRGGDIVVLRDPRAPDRRIIKRVAAVGPGRFRLGRNGVSAAGDDDGRPPDRDALEVVELAETDLLVLSEPGTAGTDSRRFGPVPRRAVEGQAWWRYEPRGRRGPLEGQGNR